MTSQGAADRLRDPRSVTDAADLSLATSEACANAIDHGRGLRLMEGLADSVEVTRGEGGTTVQLSRRLGAEAA